MKNLGDIKKKMIGCSHGGKKLYIWGFKKVIIQNGNLTQGIDVRGPSLHPSGVETKGLQLYEDLELSNRPSTMGI